MIRQKSAFAWFLAPALFLYLGFLILPMVASLPLSLFDWSGAGPIRDFLGLDNFAAALRDTAFLEAALHNVWLFVALFLFTNTVSLGLAHLLDRRYALRDVYRAIIFLPYVLSTIAIGFIWQLMLSPSIGILNPMLEAVGLGSLTQVWLGDPQFALWCVIAAFAWQWNALSTVIYLAGLQNVPKELREAAVSDGAGAWQVFRHVTVPALAPSFSTVNVLLVIVAFRAFEIAYVITGPIGAPDGATLLMGVDIYSNAFATSSAASSTTTSMSYAMAQGVLLSITLGILAFGLLSYFGRRERNAR
ncbi:carbohydrate ABC transporter permease [Rhizohabitans arisaemae]|uniref:carbohydrate ABC transporter permease n=1 Tax=Rhizohabitans arisaemae TaxID=2720610 RepID=UPI0024B1BD8E|nr:sugar ABC transporter permease [Rhizohabitans arisaemae]